MSLSAFLEVAIGLIVVYYILGLVVNVLVEITKTIFDIRAEALESVLAHAFREGSVKGFWQAIRNKNAYIDNAADVKLLKQFKDSPFYQELVPVKDKFMQWKNKQDLKPAKISKDSFSFIILDALMPSDPQALVKMIQKLLQRFTAGLNLPEEQQAQITELVSKQFESDHVLLNQLKALAQELGDGPLKETIMRLINFMQGDSDVQMDILRAILEETDLNEDLKQKLRRLLDYSVSDLTEARQRLEDWFDDIMINVSSIFTQWVRYFVVAFSVLVTIFVGADSVEIFQYLLEYPTQRAAIQTAVPALIETYGAGDISTTPETEPVAAISENLELLSEQIDTLSQLNLPLHPIWPSGPMDGTDILLKIVGLLITAIAVSQGSSFWYDILKRINPSSSSSSKESK